MRAPASSPAGGAVRAGWRESYRSPRARSRRGKRPVLKPAGQPHPTSNDAVAGVAAEAAEGEQAAIDRPPAASRSRSRARRDPSAARLAGNRARRNGRRAHPDASAALIGGRTRPVTETPSLILLRAARATYGHPQATWEIPTDGGVGVGAVEGVGRDRTVPRRVAARRTAGRRQAENPRTREFAGIEWTSGALA